MLSRAIVLGRAGLPKPTRLAATVATADDDCGHPRNARPSLIWADGGSRGTGVRQRRPAPARDDEQPWVGKSLPMGFYGVGGNAARVGVDPGAAVCAALG